MNLDLSTGSIGLADLKQLPQWVCFDAEKRPYNPHTGQLARCNDPTTWGPFNKAWRSFKGNTQKYRGVGFVLLKEQAITVIDLDKCMNEQGEISTFAQEVMSRLDTYTEYSPSKRGIHIWVRGNIPQNLGPDPDQESDGGNRIEMYDHDRYMTVTGSRVEREGQHE